MGETITDFEYLYMQRQNCDVSMHELFCKYDAMLWKMSHEFYQSFRPEGIQVHDLYQEGKLGILEGILTYQESKEVGLAHYIKLCATTHIRMALRKCRNKSYMLLSSRFSLDISIAEDASICYKDLVPCENPEYDPQFHANIEESRIILASRLQCLKEDEKMIYRFWNDGYSYLEISEKTKSDKKRIDNVIQKIKRLVETT